VIDTRVKYARACLGLGNSLSEGSSIFGAFPVRWSGFNIFLSVALKQVSYDMD
jgi:hypothetical protein